VRWPSLRGIARWTVGLGIPASLLTLAWKGADPRAGATLLVQAGPRLPLALLPYAVVMALDAFGWRLLMPAGLGRRVRMGSAFNARLAGEAVAQTLPWAGMAGEAASAWLLTRRTGVPVGRALGGLVVRRLLMAPAHGLLLAGSALAAVAQPALPLALAAAIAATAVLLLAAGAAGTRLVLDGTPFTRIQAALSQRPWPRVREWTSRRSVRLSEADRETRRLLAWPWRRRALAGGCFALVFVAEAAETLLLLRLLGVAVTPAQVLAIEPVVSLVRSLAVFAPAGLGIQDLGYVSLLYLLGVPNAGAAAAAFVLLKRLKELVWTSAGWTLLVAADANVPPGAELSCRTPAASGGAKEGGLEARAAEAAVHLRFAEPDHADASGRARAAGA